MPKDTTVAEAAWFSRAAQRQFAPPRLRDARKESAFSFFVRYGLEITIEFLLDCEVAMVRQARRYILSQLWGGKDLYYLI